jgi:hypothetical protein
MSPPKVFYNYPSLQLTKPLAQPKASLGITQVIHDLRPSGLNSQRGIADFTPFALKGVNP